MDAKEIRDGQVQANGMAASLSQHAFRKAGCAAGVDYVDGIRRLDRDTRRPHGAGAGALDEVLPLPLAL
jgi:hypothetical protein